MSQPANPELAGPGLQLEFKQLLQTLPAAAYACDKDGLITYFNPQAERIWGRAPSLNDPIDRYCGSFKLFSATAEPLAHDQCWMALTLREGRPYEGGEIIIEQPDGTRVPALAYANPVHDSNGELIGAVNVLVDISERKRLEDTVRHSQRDFSDFFEQGSLALHCVGPDGTIQRANQAELEMLGYEQDEYVGHHISEFHADKETIEDILKRLAAGETLRNYEARARCKDGSIKHVAINSNVLWEDGQFVHTRCFTRDITAQKRAEAALRDADTRKNDFIAMLAHELRNPLEPIVSSVEYLRRQGPEDPALNRARDVINRQVSHMTRLIDDLLSVARITRGKLHVSRKRIALEEVLASAVETVQPVLDEAGHQLTLSLPDRPLYLDVDPVRMSQVFSNLLGNAAKYTDPGGHIRIGAERVSGTPGDPDTIALVVEDDGIGISAAELPLIFEMFVQLDTPGRGAGKGLGVGLALARSIVEMHAGSIEAYSAGPGRGSSFAVRLPLAEAPEAQPPTAEQPKESIARRRVLIVDDHQDSAEGISILLSLDGHETRTAFDAGQALRAAEAFRPDVILLDIGLPDLDGYETCRRLRSTAWGADSFIVAISGWGQRDDKRKARDAGFDVHLTKPVETDALRGLLAARD